MVVVAMVMESPTIFGKRLRKFEFEFESGTIRSDRWWGASSCFAKEGVGSKRRALIIIIVQALINSAGVRKQSCPN